MPLSPHEQYQLNVIETGFREQDPGFAAKLTVTAADRSRRRHLAVAHGCLWLGMVLSLVGFGVVHQVLATGVLLILYGTGVMLFAIVKICAGSHQRPGSPGQR